MILISPASVKRRIAMQADRMDRRCLGTAPKVPLICSCCPAEARPGASLVANPPPPAMDKTELGWVEWCLWVEAGLVGNARKCLEFKQVKSWG